MIVKCLDKSIRYSVYIKTDSVIIITLISGINRVSRWTLMTPIEDFVLEKNNIGKLHDTAVS